MNSFSIACRGQGSVKLNATEASEAGRDGLMRHPHCKAGAVHNNFFDMRHFDINVRDTDEDPGRIEGI